MSNRHSVLPIALTILVVATMVGFGFAEPLPIDMFDGGGGEGSAEVTASASPELTTEEEIVASVEAPVAADVGDVSDTADDDDRVVLTVAEEQEEIAKAEEGNLLAALSIEMSGEISGEGSTAAEADRSVEPEMAAGAEPSDRAEIAGGTE